MDKGESIKSDLNSLLKDFHHPNPKINYQAYLNMVKYWPEESMLILLANLDDKDLAIRRKSVKAIGCFGKKALPPITFW